MAQLYAKKASDGFPKALECTDDGLLKVDTEISATIDPAGLATQATLAAVLAKLSADPATQTTLAALLAKVIAAPATEAKQPALEGTDKAKVSLYVKKSANGDTVLTLGKAADADSIPVALSTESLAALETISLDLDFSTGATGAKTPRVKLSNEDLAALVGLQTGSPASVSVDEDGTARTLTELIKALKNLGIDTVGHLATIAADMSKIDDMITLQEVTVSELSDMTALLEAIVEVLDS